MDHRTERMENFIKDAFYDLLETEDFSEITIGQMAQKAQINRSTFYRHFADKYQLRDAIVDEIVQDFVDNLEVEFLDLDVSSDRVYDLVLLRSLEHIYTKKRYLQILWKQKLLGRNVFEEMIEGGARKLEQRILQHDRISPEKKHCADWYASLLVNNMLVTVRWWFRHDHDVDARRITEMMKQHMSAGTIPTLKQEF